MRKIKQGLDIPITGEPEQTLSIGKTVRSVAVNGIDYIGMKPTMHVSIGDKVKKGQLLFTDKKNDGVRYTSPATGMIAAINRGEKRVLQSIVIDIDKKDDNEKIFKHYPAEALKELSSTQVETLLNQAGLWTALRTRPYSKVPQLNTQPASIFITAIDTHPLAANPAIIIAEHRESFAQGIRILGKLCEGKIYLCKSPNANITAGIATAKEFSGPHPAGLPGTHIHFIDPVNANKIVWYINYQDVIAVGKLFTTGRLYVKRIISIAGPQVLKPRLVETRLGACLDELLSGELKTGDNRIISGSILGGRTARGAFNYLGRYHLQASVLEEGTERHLLHWLNIGSDRHSTLNILLSKLNPRRLFNYTTTTNGSERAMIPIGNYERVMPLDILATQLLRAIVVGDTDMAQKLGILELDEEDLALCSYVCAGKYEYGPILRDNLTRIEVEG